MKTTYNAELMFFTFCSSCSILAFVSSINSITVAGLAQSVEHLTTERKVEGSIPGDGQVLSTPTKTGEALIASKS